MRQVALPMVGEPFNELPADVNINKKAEECLRN